MTVKYTPDHEWIQLEDHEAAVVGIADDTGDEIIRAFVTLKEGMQAEKQELMKLCRGKLAPYKCPKDLEIRKELPKNTLGKILKRELRKPGLPF